MLVRGLGAVTGNNCGDSGVTEGTVVRASDEGGRALDINSRFGPFWPQRRQ